MELTGQRQIAAPRETVYAALNDPEILRQAIPGCESLEKAEDGGFAATVSLKIGPVKARFNGSVQLTNLNPPESYTLVGEGKGGAAGFARGKADVELQEVPEGTLLNYKVHADLGGKIAQLGSRLVQGTADKLSAQFFETFATQVEAGSAAPAPASESAPEAAAAPAPAPATSAPTPSPAAAPAPQAASEPAAKQGGIQSWVWWAVGGIVAVLAAVVILA